MNTRPFISRRTKANPTNAVGNQVQILEKSVKRAQKRWQSKRLPMGHPIAMTPAEHETRLRQQALEQVHYGNFDAALSLFNRLLLLNPSSARDYNNRGLVYFQGGRMVEAIADYNRALDINPMLDSAYNNRANYYAVQGQLLEAVLDYDAALELNPENIRAWINQGITFRDMQMYDRAIESFDAALALNCLQGHVYSERGRTYHLWGDWNCAIADYQRALDTIKHSESSAVDNNSTRLHLHVAAWMNELLSPLEV
ncbi:MAG: tetratricopeptide repeat protein [Kaiparowitsia implicata GSE-PSE-MK54-09C]|jgi:tetratricopeptide (TPR) repeat protein|nr:tetratricopeptide repeat protein [Kaiparowitsia implicata GSE-PSE-MK54-09C]